MELVTFRYQVDGAPEELARLGDSDPLVRDFVVDDRQVGPGKRFADRDDKATQMLRDAVCRKLGRRRDGSLRIIARHWQPCVWFRAQFRVEVDEGALARFIGEGCEVVRVDGEHRLQRRLRMNHRHVGEGQRFETLEAKTRDMLRDYVRSVVGPEAIDTFTIDVMEELGV